jgi:hypothetical protein
MVIQAFPVVGKAKAARICEAFIAGASRSAVGAVFYGVNESNVHEWHRAKAGPHPWFYIDNSYFDSVRGEQYRIAKNRVQTKVPGNVSDGKRFAALGLKIAPMNVRPSDLWIAIEQSPSFMRYVADDPTWLERAAQAVVPGHHRMKVRRWSPNKPKQQETLPADLAGAWTLITHSSAAAVTATLMGVPVVVSPRSALTDMRVSTDPKHDQRQHYMEVLADNQWTIAEIRAGKAWAWLNRA